MEIAVTGNVIVGMGNNALPAERFHIKRIHVCNYSPFRHQATTLGKTRVNGAFLDEMKAHKEIHFSADGGCGSADELWRDIA